MKTKKIFLACLVVALLILQNSFSQAKQAQSQKGRAISLIPKFELKVNEKGMPGAVSGKSALCEISSIVYEPKGKLEPNTFFSATVTYKATGENYFTEQTKTSPANKTEAKIIKGGKKTLVVKYTKNQSQKDEESPAEKRNIKQEREIEKAKTLASDDSAQEQQKGAPAILRQTPFEFEGGDGTAENPFLIKTAEQLNSIRFGLDFHYKLISDIDLSKWGNWIPIGGTPSFGGSHGGQTYQEADEGGGKFSGSLDGNGHVISGMTIIDHRDDIFMGTNEAERSYALFAEMIAPKDFKQKQNNFVKDLGIINYTIDVSYTNLKYKCTLNAAALSTSAASRTFENCYSSGGKIKIHTRREDEEETFVTIYAGGLVSSAIHSKIINCYNTSPLIITTSDTDYINTQIGSKRMVMAGGITAQTAYSDFIGCMNSGEISVPYANWGLAALSAGIVARVTIDDAPENIYSAPPSGATNITSCYNIGTIRGTYVGGIMGYTGTDCYVSDCYNAGTLEIDELNPNKEPSLIIKADIAIPICKIFNYGKKYIHDNGIKTVSGERWTDSPTLGRKVLKAIPEDKLGIKPSEPEAPVQVAGFSDVMSSDSFANSVPWSVEKGIAKPSSKTKFSPDEPCTRGQVLTYIYRWNGSPKSSIKNPFKDVKPSDSFYNAALWAYEKGLFKGSTLNGNQTCTRGDAVEFLWKYANSYPMNPADNFTDVPRSSKYHSAVSWAYWMRIATGTTPTTFEPDSACTKAQIVTFIYNLEHSHFMDWLKMALEQSGQ